MLKDKRRVSTEKDETNLMIRIDSTLKQKVVEKALKSDLTMSQVIRRLLTDYVNEPQAKLNF